MIRPSGPTAQEMLPSPKSPGLGKAVLVAPLVALRRARLRKHEADQLVSLAWDAEAPGSANGALRARIEFELELEDGTAFLVDLPPSEAPS